MLANFKKIPFDQQHCEWRGKFRMIDSILFPAASNANVSSKTRKGQKGFETLSSLVQPCPALSSLVQLCPALSSFVQLCPALLARDKSCAFRSLAVISCLWSLTEYLKEQPREWEQIFRSDRINWSSCSHCEWSEYKREREEKDCKCDEEEIHSYSKMKPESK